MKKETAIALLGILLATGGIAAPLIWDYYSHQSALEIRILSSKSMLANDPILSDISIRYKGKIVNSLTRMDFALVNVGRTPISASDVVSYPTIEFPRGTEIIAASITRQDPRNLNQTIVALSDAPTVLWRFDLLNPGDYGEIAVYLTAQPDPSAILISARVRGIRQIGVVDNSAQSIQLTSGPSWLVYPVGAVTLFFLWLASESGRDTVRIRRMNRLVQSGMLDKVNDIKELERIFFGSMGFLMEDDKKRIEGLLESCRKDFSEKNKSELIFGIKKATAEKGGGPQVIFYFLALPPATVGLLYVGWEIVRAYILH